MQKVLIVEDSRTFASLLSRGIQNALAIDSEWAASLAEAREILEQRAGDFFLAMLDLNLPDAPSGEVVDLVAGHGLPSIVFTGELGEDLRERIWAKGIVDYVFKESAENIAYIVQVIEGLLANPHQGVLVVDDSPTTRNHLAALLKVHRYDVHAAADGQEALAILAENSAIRLAIIDFNMPDMDGCQLTRAMRRQHDKDRLAIIGISGQGDTGLSARFLKAGANDYLNKPFIIEEFYCRVSQNLEVMRYIDRIRELSETDFLTGISNRKYLFDLGQVLYANQSRSSMRLSAALLDIDDFKKINDTHGHAAGDAVLKAVADVLRSRFRKTDIVSRYGGEEFCILAANLERDAAAEVFESVRQAIEQLTVTLGSTTISCTVSIGVCLNPMNSLDDMIRQADALLYQAKAAGKNQVRMFPEPM